MLADDGDSEVSSYSKELSGSLFWASVPSHDPVLMPAQWYLLEQPLEGSSLLLPDSASLPGTGWDRPGLQEKRGFL